MNVIITIVCPLKSFQGFLVLKLMEISSGHSELYMSVMLQDLVHVPIEGVSIRRGSTDFHREGTVFTT